MSAIPLGPAYARLWSATALSNLGDGIRAAAFPLLAASLTSSPVLVTGVAVAGQLPGLLFGLVAGVVADRVNRGVLVLAMDLVRTVLLVGLVALVATGHAIGLRWTIVGSLLVAAVGQLALGITSSTIITAIVLATSSLVFAVWNVAARTLIQRRTPLEMLGRITSINRTVVTAVSILGALFGGIVAQQLGLHAPFLLGVPLLLAATVISWWALRPPRQPR